MPTKPSILNKREPLVFSIGGSIVNPGEVDRKFLRALRALLLGQAEKRRLGVVVGGGSVARTYIAAAKALGVHEHTAQHWIGIRATVLNAELLRFVLGSDASPVIATYAKPLSRHRIVVGAGEEPGWSTDYDTILLAEKLAARTVYNLSNINYVYEKDPARYPQARILKDLTWKEYVRRFPLVYTPGMHLPFDPYAVRRARKNGMTVVILNGRNTANLRKALAGEPFQGTVVHP